MSNAPKNNTKVILSFLSAIQKDDRVKRTHISLFLALCIGGEPQEGSAKLRIRRKDIMLLAKIGSISTYHRCMKELVAFGYIAYKPSYDYYRGSMVRFLSRI